MQEKDEIYDTIKEGGSMQILGHLMRVLASNYFFAVRIISTDNLFLHLLLITRFSSPLVIVSGKYPDKKIRYR